MKENIEEVVERLEKSINDIWFSTTYNQEDEERDLQALLSKYKRVLKENEELKSDNYELNNRINDLLDSISKQKIKDKIEEIKNNKPYLMKFDDWKNEEYTNEDIINNCIDVLKELLEEKGD